MRTCTPAPDLRAAHLSLWYGAKPEHVADYIAAVIEHEDVDLVTTTESKHRARAVRRRLGRKHWRIQSRGEYMVVSRRSVFRRWHGWPARLRRAAGARWHLRGGADRTYAVMVSNLRHKPTGKRVRAMVCHTPSHVQIGRHFRALPRVSAWTKGLAKWGKWIRHCARRHKHVVQVAALDSNVENHLRHWRRVLEDGLGLRSVWHRHRPQRGSLGHRLIDTAHTNAHVKDARLCEVDPPHDIDHHGIVYRLDMEG